MKTGYVYITANRKNGAIYIGSTANLTKRIHEHRSGATDGFTKRHGCDQLVWYEVHDDLQAAREREMRMKRWKRDWKIRLIEESNGDWDDLWFSIVK